MAEHLLALRKRRTQKEQLGRLGVKEDLPIESDVTNQVRMCMEIINSSESRRRNKSRLFGISQG